MVNRTTSTRPLLYGALTLCLMASAGFAVLLLEAMVEGRP